MSADRPYGRYILEERIAMGGMAEIFRARTATEGFEKRVCIKRVLPHFLESEDFVTMFRDEARLAARLQHQNVVQMFDFGEEGGTLYLAMELVDGGDLKRMIDRATRRHLRFGVGQAAQIAIEMARGLHHAHNLVGDDGNPLGLVHRDISPHNVLLSRSGEVKITDFGIAKAAERASHTSTGVVKGKLSYMAPEQADGSGIDHRVDQFATALVFWECLCGEKLFAGDNEAIILRKVLTCDVMAPSERRPDVPKEIDAIVMKALSPKAQDRYADMRAFEQALTRAVYLLSDDPAFTDLRPLVETLLDDAASQPRKTAVMRGPAAEEQAAAARDLGPPPSVSTGEASAVFASGPESKKQVIAHAALREAGLLADQGAETVMASETVVASAPPDFLDDALREGPIPSAGDSTEPTRTIVPNDVLGGGASAQTEIGGPPPSGAASTVELTGSGDLSGSGDFSAGPEPPAAFPRRSDLEAIVPTERVPRAPGPGPQKTTIPVPVLAGGAALAVAVVAAVGLSMGGGAAGQADPPGPEAPPPVLATATERPQEPIREDPEVPTSPKAVQAAPASPGEPEGREEESVEQAPPPAAEERPAAKAGRGKARAPRPREERDPSDRPTATKPGTRKGPGKVFVDVTGSWAVVYEGKKRLGETPVTLKLPAGRHKLRLKNPETGQERSVTVEVEADQLVKAIQKL